MQGVTLNNLSYLHLDRNLLSGPIPAEIGNMKSLQNLSLHSNNLFGLIPNELGNLKKLNHLGLSNNQLSGPIPRGRIPHSLENCQRLEVVDLGDNLLNDTFAMWLGTLPKLQVLSLRSNKLHGPIRTSRFSKNLFPRLQIIDLASNAFSAELPVILFQNLEAMKRVNQTLNESSNTGDGLYTAVDFSSNRFEGDIPGIMGDLIALRVLNLSHNELEGHIPTSLGNLPSVESLDRSSNHLEGKIPEQLTSLTLLEFLNLYYNQLQGCIPTGPQFATFEKDSYTANKQMLGGAFGGMVIGNAIISGAGAYVAGFDF
ncbi:hypothetical protein BC332_31452 [Capsicum chinense]|nr:hypothetical protein BC332_31452 [Capsicum chinense]